MLFHRCYRLRHPGVWGHISDGRWVAVGDSGDATTTAVGATIRWQREGWRAHCGCSKTNIRLGQVESFPGWKLAWKSLRGSYAEGASYCRRFGRPVPIDRCLVNFPRTRRYFVVASAKLHDRRVHRLEENSRIPVSCNSGANSSARRRICLFSTGVDVIETLMTL